LSDHTKDVQAIHDALTAVKDFAAGVATSDLSHTDWVETIQGVREKVKTFALFVPNADRIEHMLDVAEKVVLGIQAVQRIAQKV
jgi:hypothetical protein